MTALGGELADLHLVTSGQAAILRIDWPGGNSGAGGDSACPVFRGCTGMAGVFVARAGPNQ